MNECLIHEAWTDTCGAVCASAYLADRAFDSSFATGSEISAAQRVIEGERNRILDMLESRRRLLVGEYGRGFTEAVDRVRGAL